MKKPKDNATTAATRVAPSEPDGGMRFELCDTIFNDYKGATFFLDQMLEQKKRSLPRSGTF